MHIKSLSCAVALVLVASACAPEPDYLAPSQAAATTVKLDFFAKPFPEIPLPNDVATRYDPKSPTLRRINASLLAPTSFEETTRELLNELDGWGVLQQITIPFTGPIDVNSLIAGHRDDDYRFDNDVIYLVNIDRGSDKFGTFTPVDLGNGNYPLLVERPDAYWDFDLSNWQLTLAFEEADEDTNGNGILDPGEDADADGILDKPNYLPGASPPRDALSERADALMTFYEAQSHTIIARPLVPLEEKTKYAVVVTRRLLDINGAPVGSPYPGINHASQTHALEPLAEVLATQGVALTDVAFAFSYTTQSVTGDWIAVRDGLYGHGVQGHLATEFPAELSVMYEVRDRDYFPDMVNPFVLYQEDWKPAFELVVSQFLGGSEGALETNNLLAAGDYTDFHALGGFNSPQLFQRTDADGKTLNLGRQHWPHNLETTPVTARSEDITFHLMVPRKEISARGEGKPAPVAIIGHGYGSNRFDIAILGPHLVRHGIAVIAIDSMSHGIQLSESETETATNLLALLGLSSFFKAIVDKDRANDLNGDGSDDSGGDFWTAYLFHTRDAVRQTALDYMQLVRIIRSFDGTRTWKVPQFDGSPGLPTIAGDFDGDGIIDIGGDAPITMLGASLGGIMAAVVGGVEPEVTTNVPIAAGGGLGDASARSIQGGVREAIILRVLNPLYLGAGDGSDFAFSTVVTDVNDDTKVVLNRVAGVQVGDFITVDNKRNGVRGCGWVRTAPDGMLIFRTAVESNVGDPTHIRVWAGDAMLLGSRTCETKSDAVERASVDTFGEETTFLNKTYAAGAPLVALAEGLGLQRGSQNLRRNMGLGQLILDKTDPAVMTQYATVKSISYPGTGQTTASHTLHVTTVGDMNVPASTGVTMGRAAGLIDYKDNRLEGHNTFQNQVLLDTFTAEATEFYKRYTNAAGEGVLMDVENFSKGTDPWGTDVPRLDPPFHPNLGQGAKDKLGGYSAAIFPYAIPTGQHGFAFPGGLIDQARKDCKAACADGDCGCNQVTTFDVGRFLFNMFGRYMATNGMELPAGDCLVVDDCGFIAPVPPQRPSGR